MNPLAWFLIIIGLLLLVIGFQGKQDAFLSALIGHSFTWSAPPAANTTAATTTTTGQYQ